MDFQTSAIAGRPSSSFTFAMCQNDGEVYARLLLPKSLGFPLWVPQPHRNLPIEYRRTGVNIGDVGIVTPSGVFDFLFNICLPSHHLINGNRVPDNFRPLEAPEPVDIIDVTVAPTHIASGWIERSQLSLHNSVHHLITLIDAILSRTHPPRSGGEFSFRCFAPEGAILTLPDGVTREDLQGIARFREYAVRNAGNWYKYAKGPRGRNVENGAIYLVTGCDKSKSWGVASFSGVPASFNLNFVPATAEGGNANITSTWEHTSFASTNSGPTPVEYFDGDRPRNQCTFIRGFKISLSQGLWATLFGPMPRVSSIANTMPSTNTSFIPRRGGVSWLKKSFFRSSSQRSRENNLASERSASGNIGRLVPDDNVIIASDLPLAHYVSITLRQPIKFDSILFLALSPNEYHK